MRQIDDYSDDELRRLLAKAEGVTGARERAQAIREALDARSVEDGRKASLDRLSGTMDGDVQPAQ